MNTIRNLILDMDGVLWRGNTAMPGLIPFIETLRQKNIRFVFATNNASRTIDNYVVKFSKLGVTVKPWQILSAGYVTAAHLAKRYPANSTVFIVGDRGLHHAMREAGFHVINQPRERLGVDAGRAADTVQPYIDQYPQVDLVVVGFTVHVTYGEFALATLYINRGASFWGSNGDTSFPNELGRFPGAGSFLSLLETATGIKPTTIGKPHPFIFEDALERLGSVAAETAMVGDRLDTDVLGANRCGLTSILLYSGIATPDDVMHSDIKPDFIFDDISALTAVLE